MYFKRILYSILGLRRNKDLEADLKNINLIKIIFFSVTLVFAFSVLISFVVKILINFYE
ncbi:MAG: hypothetical protein NT02SARS_1062 [SAR86 cluster bacterium SAR86B]|jgi:hypothetical protein|uniref:DUF2970 domain-containing protein n=1 Tax=SAR86 cluster bacterium SAR86B TaxID=1123867 RepID=J4WWQ8_9GAMM|nr:MAG: hypothetical protein NT02SARS_1062 [SAR86 cluster bacterium SAR86B]